MADSTLKIETPTSADEIPEGIALDGMSADEAAQGLFDALAEDPEFSENEESEQSTPQEGDLEGEGEEFEEDLGDDLDDAEEAEEEEVEEADENFESEEDGENEEKGREDLYEVTLPGGEKAEVTLDELQAGYSRTEDYTRKRQRDASEHASAMTEVREIREKYADGLTQLEDTLSKLGPQQPAATLRKSNPGEYAAQMAEWQAYQDTLGKIGEAKGAVSDEKEHELAEARQALVHEQWNKVVAEVPEWSDQAKATTELAQLRNHAIDNLGFSAEEVDSLVDARLLLMLKENYDLKQKRQKGKKVVEKKRKSSKRLKPGSVSKTPKSKKAARRQQQEADQLAAKTGSMRDAARAIEMLLD